jgi:adenylate kinase
MDIIFVAGIHGVGKTSCCKQVSEVTGIPHFSASSIIKAGKATAISANSKAVRDIEGNQRLLAQGLVKIAEAGHARIILDGHCTLLNSLGQVEPISLDVFSPIGLNGVIVFRDDPDKICVRLRARDERVYEAATINEHQDAEVAQAQFVASK